VLKQLVKCEACSKQFLDIDRHNRDFHPKHASEQCDLCHKAVFRLASQLRAHKEHVHGQLPEFCAICNVAVKHLSRHLVSVHETPPLRLACDVPDCPTTFLAPSHKRLHMARVHAGERSRCDLCDKEVSSLAAHQRHVHGGPPTHSCPICIKSFRTATHLRDETDTQDLYLYGTGTCSVSDPISGAFFPLVPGYGMNFS
jgi:hypothetical protein